MKSFLFFLKIIKIILSKFILIKNKNVETKILEKLGPSYLNTKFNDKYGTILISPRHQTLEEIVSLKIKNNQSWHKDELSMLTFNLLR